MQDSHQTSSVAPSDSEEAGPSATRSTLVDTTAGDATTGEDTQDSRPFTGGREQRGPKGVHFSASVDSPAAGSGAPHTAGRGVPLLTHPTHGPHDVSSSLSSDDVTPSSMQPRPSSPPHLMKPWRATGYDSLSVTPPPMPAPPPTTPTTGGSPSKATQTQPVKVQLPRAMTRVLTQPELSVSDTASTFSAAREGMGDSDGGGGRTREYRTQTATGRMADWLTEPVVRTEGEEEGGSVTDQAETSVVRTQGEEERRTATEWTEASAVRTQGEGERFQGTKWPKAPVNRDSTGERAPQWPKVPTQRDSTGERAPKWPKAPTEGDSPGERVAEQRKAPAEGGSPGERAPKQPKAPAERDITGERATKAPDVPQILLTPSKPKGECIHIL